MSNPLYSILVPVMNEAGNILPLSAAVADAMAPFGAYEIIFVDDASRDTTVAEILQAKALNPSVRLIRHAQNRGQSRALRTAAEAARAPWLITIDGDMQNPPSEIAKLIAAKPDDMNGAVAGIREKRQDTAARRWASRMANRIRQRALNDDCPDTGCSLKLFPREAFLRLPYFDHMHRYLPPLFQLYGLGLAYVKVAHQPRAHGVSKYTNWQRALVGIIDLLGVRWIQRRTHIVNSWEEE